MDRKVDTRYLVTDPQGCCGDLVFRGTSLTVADLLEDIASGASLWGITKGWRGVPKAAITEAILLAEQAFVDHADEYVIEYAVDTIPA